MRVWCQQRELGNEEFDKRFDNKKTCQEDMRYNPPQVFLKHPIPLCVIHSRALQVSYGQRKKGVDKI